MSQPAGLTQTTSAGHNQPSTPATTATEALALRASAAALFAVFTGHPSARVPQGTRHRSPLETELTRHKQENTAKRLRAAPGPGHDFGQDGDGGRGLPVGQRHIGRPWKPREAGGEQCVLPLPTGDKG